MYYFYVSAAFIGMVNYFMNYWESLGVNYT